MKKIGLIILSLLIAPRAHAACPVCTIAVGGMMVFLEKFGVDNTISGIWIGGFIISTTLMSLNWLNKKEIKFAGREIILLLFFYISLVVPFYLKGILGIPSKMMWGMDKALLGMMVGGLAFHLAHLTYLKIKARNGGRPWFPFQRVVMPLLALGYFSIVFYLLTSTKYLWHEIKGYAETPLLWLLIPITLVLHLLLFRSMNKMETKSSCH